MPALLPRSPLLPLLQTAWPARSASIMPPGSFSRLLHLRPLPHLCAQRSPSHLQVSAQIPASQGGSLRTLFKVAALLHASRVSSPCHFPPCGPPRSTYGSLLFSRWPMSSRRLRLLLFTFCLFCSLLRTALGTPQLLCKPLLNECTCVHACAHMSYDTHVALPLAFST